MYKVPTGSRGMAVEARLNMHQWDSVCSSQNGVRERENKVMVVFIFLK